jgi:hypothetical protein
MGRRGSFKSEIPVQSTQQSGSTFVPFSVAPDPALNEYLTGAKAPSNSISLVPTTAPNPEFSKYVASLEKPKEKKDKKSSVPSAITGKKKETAQSEAEAPSVQEQSFLSKLFESSPVEPGEYSTGRKIGEGAIQFLGNFGNNIAGNSQANTALNQGFAQRRQEYMDKDPNSRSSILYRGMAQRMGLPIKGDESAFILKEQMPNVREFLSARQLDLNERMARMKGTGTAQKPLGTEQQKIVSNSAMSLSGIQGMRDALSRGSNTFSIVGDNDFTNARKAFVEGFGRLQSGGVIGKDEIETYESMAPKVTDTPKQQQDKLRNLEAEIRSRIELAGMNPDEVMNKRSESAARGQVKFVRDNKTGKTLKVNALGEVLE